MPPEPPHPRFDGDPGASAADALFNELLSLAQSTIEAQAQRIRDLERTNERHHDRKIKEP